MTNYKFVNAFISNDYKYNYGKAPIDQRRSLEEVNQEALKIAKEILKAQKDGDETTLLNYSLHLEYNIDGVVDILEELKKES